MRSENSNAGFGAAPAHAAPSLVENSELQRAERAVLEWAERYALVNREDLDDFIDNNRDLRGVRSLSTCSSSLSRLVWLVNDLQNTRVLNSARRIETKTTHQKP